MRTHVSDLILDALRVGAPVPSEAAAHLLSCPACQARQRVLDDAAQAFHARFDVAGLAAEARAQASAPRVPWWRAVLGPAGVLVAAGLAVFVLAPPSEAPGPTGLREKGAAPLVEVFVLDGAARAPLTGAVPSRARLAVRVSAPGPRAVRVVWTSTAGSATALHPVAAEPAWRVAGPTWLDREVVLDGAPEPEWLGVVACEAEVSADEAARMLRDAPRADCAMSSVRIEKR